MKSLSIPGTAAMFLVSGGGIVTQGIPWLHHCIGHAAGSVEHSGGLGALVAPLVPSLLNRLCGLIAGMIVLLEFPGIRKLGNNPADH